MTVVPDGFLWQEKTYSSLSTIAQLITGTKWNGPRFFGLRVPGAQEDRQPRAESAPANLKPTPRGRSSVQASGRRSAP